MTIIIDDAGVGDLLFGVVIGAYRPETNEFKYAVIDVKYFQPPRYGQKLFQKEAAKIVLRLLDQLKLGEKERLLVCQGYVFDNVVPALKKQLGEDRVELTRIVGEAQRHIETAYLDELRNLGYEPIHDREERRAKSFFHMMRWVKQNPRRMRYAKTGWPRLKNYKFLPAKRASY